MLGAGLAGILTIAAVAVVLHASRIQPNADLTYPSTQAVKVGFGGEVGFRACVTLWICVTLAFGALCLYRLLWKVAGLGE